MKTPTIHITATSAVQIVVKNADGGEVATNTPIPPFKSVFAALFELLNDALDCPADADITVECNGLTYKWRHDLAHFCFAEGTISEMDMANGMLETNDREG